MLCTNCGAKLQPEKRFCTVCGFLVSEQLDSVENESAESFIISEAEDDYQEENNLVEEETNLFPKIIRNKDELTNKLKDKFSNQKNDLINVLKERRKEAKFAFKKAVNKTKESLAKILEDEIDVMEQKLETS